MKIRKIVSIQLFLCSLAIYRKNIYLYKTFEVIGNLKKIAMQLLKDQQFQ